MLKTKTNEYHQIVVDHQNYDQLHTRYGANRSFNEVITEILKHHQLAIEVITNCEHCATEFKAAVKSQ
jgi:predicted CopG family antitoxin